MTGLKTDGNPTWFGKSPKEVEDVLDKPDSAAGNPSLSEFWAYRAGHNLVKDEVRGNGLGFSMIFIRNAVHHVNLQSF